MNACISRPNNQFFGSDDAAKQKHSNSLIIPQNKRRATVEVRHSVRSVWSSSMLRWTTDIHTAAFLKSCSFRVMMFACRAEKGRQCLRVLPWRIYHCVTDKREMSEGIRFSLGEQRVMQRWNVQSEMCSKTQQSQVN